MRPWCREEWHLAQTLCSIWARSSTLKTMEHVQIKKHRLLIPCEHTCGAQLLRENLRKTALREHTQWLQETNAQARKLVLPATWCNLGQTSTFPSTNIPPLINKIPPIHRAENEIKRGGYQHPVGIPHSGGCPHPLLLPWIKCIFVLFAPQSQCEFVCVCICLFFLGFLCSLPRFFWTSWKRAWTLVKLFLYQPYFSISLYLVTQIVKNLPVIREIRVRSLGWEIPLEKEMATHSSILTWWIPWTEEPVELQSTGSKRVIRDWMTNTLLKH